METIQYDGLFISAAVYNVDNREILENIDKLLNDLKTSNCLVVIFRASHVISLKQILFAAVSAILAFKSKTNIARKLDVEILVRLSSESQIDEAIKKISMDRETKDAGICVLSRSKEELQEFSKKLTEIIDGLEFNEEDLHTIDRINAAKNFYNITDEEINSVQARELHEAVLLLILERIATIDIRR